MTDSKKFVVASLVADWLGLSVRRVRELAAAGILVKVGRDKYDLRSSVRSYAAHMREQAAGRAGLDPSTDIAAANVKLKEANVRLANLRYDKEAGRLIERAALHALWGPLVLGVKQRMLSWPGKAAFLVPTLTAADRAALEQMTRDDLTDASLGRGFDFGGDEIDDKGKKNDE